MSEQNEKLVEFFKHMDIQDEQIQTEYSGRSMFNRTCIGVVLNEGNNALSFTVLCLTELFTGYYDDDEDMQEVVLNAFNCVRTDNMGLDTIIYFPGR